MAYGFLGFVGLTKETNWGSATSVLSGDFVEALSEDLQVTLERFPFKAMIASAGEPDDAVGLRRVAGSVRFAAHPVPLGTFLRSALHSYTQSTVLSGFLHSHVFVTTSGGSDFDSQVPIQPYTFEIHRDVTSSFIFGGGVVDSLTLNFGQGAVMVDASIIARNVALSTKSTPTFPGSPSKPFTFDTVSLGLAGAGTALIETLAVKITNNLQGFGALNLSTDIAKIRRTNHQMVEVSGTIDFTNVTEYLNFLNQTEQRLTVSATKTSSFSLVVDIPRLVYTAYPVSVSGRERITTSFTGKGFVHPGSLNAIKISITNTRSSY